jgi:transposase
MNEGETIKQLQELIEQLRRENELLKAKISELEARLAQYENAHTPPSLKRGLNHKKDGDKVLCWMTLQRFHCQMSNLSY